MKFIGVDVHLKYKALTAKGFIQLNDDNISNKHDKGMVEVFQHATFSTLLGYIPLKKGTEEGINERKELLKSIGFNNLDKFLNKVKKLL
jgi:hypothetical protein